MSATSPYVYVPITIPVFKDGVCLFETGCEARVEYELPDGPDGPIDWDVTAFHFADKNVHGRSVYTQLTRVEPLFHVLYNAMDREWIDTQTREALAADGLVNLYADPARD